jgi:hypothetical protein
MGLIIPGILLDLAVIYRLAESGLAVRMHTCCNKRKLTLATFRLLGNAYNRMPLSYLQGPRILVSWLGPYSPYPSLWHLVAGLQGHILAVT